MAIVKGFKLPPLVVKGGLNKNKSSRLFNRAGLKIYFSDGAQRINARRFRPKSPKYTASQLRAMNHFRNAECAWKALPKTTKEALRQYMRSHNATSTSDLDLYRWFKHNYSSDKMDDIIRNYLDIGLELAVTQETRAKAYLRLKAIDAHPDKEYAEWSDGKHNYKIRLAKRWLPYDYCTIYVSKDPKNQLNDVYHFVHRLPKSNETHFSIDKEFLYEEYGKGTYYIMAVYRGIWSNVVSIDVDYFPYELWGTMGFYFENWTQGITRWIGDVHVSAPAIVTQKQPIFPIVPYYLTSFYAEDRAGLSNCDWDYDDIILHVYKYKGDILVEVYGTNGGDHNVVFFEDSDGNTHYICDCPPHHSGLDARVLLHPFTRKIKKINY